MFDTSVCRRRSSSQKSAGLPASQPPLQGPYSLEARYQPYRRESAQTLLIVSALTSTTAIGDGQSGMTTADEELAGVYIRIIDQVVQPSGTYASLDLGIAL